MVADLRFSSISVESILADGLRLEAAVYTTEIASIREHIDLMPGLKRPLAGTQGLSVAYHKPRFKRPYVTKPGIPFFQPAQIADLDPKPARYLAESASASFEHLRVRQGQILLTCSGTVGKTAIVGSTLDGSVFSHDLIRLDAKDGYLGLVFAFLKSSAGQTLMKSANYGAVIQHIEPSFLSHIQVPVPPEHIVAGLNEDISESVRLLDEANALIRQAKDELVEAAGIGDVNVEPSPNTAGGVTNFCVRSDQLNMRLDASHHDRYQQVVLQAFSDAGVEWRPLGDGRLTSSVSLPGQFKRTYVELDHGIPFFSGKDIAELDPYEKKHLALSQHSDRIRDELTIRENMVLVTCSGSVGNTALVPKHWDGWAMTHDIIRVNAVGPEEAAYLFAWISTPQGSALVKKHAYGAVVQHIEDHHLVQVPVPVLDPLTEAAIASKVLKASKLRTKAYRLEEKAVKTLDQAITECAWPAEALSATGTTIVH